jgi:hypothetical protein
VEELERRISRLRIAVREAVLAGDTQRARALRHDLRQAEQDWEDALTRAADTPSTDTLSINRPAQGSPAALIPLREQVHQALSLLSVPAAPRLLATTHEAFFGGSFPSSRLTSLKRDEERSFRTAPFARPYYICAALTTDRLAPARGLLAISTWPMERRVIGSLSMRVDFLTAAIHLAEAIERLPGPVPAASRLLWRFATSIPGTAGKTAGKTTQLDPGQVTDAAMAELEVHEAADRRSRKAGAQRARERLDDAEQLFGTRLQVSTQLRSES